MFGGEAFDGIGKAFVFLLVVALISTPFALWKLVETVLWICSHLQWVS